MQLKSIVGLFASSLALAAVPNGPALGSRVPIFEAPDQNGLNRTLQSIKGPKGTILVFYRSADW